MTVPYIFASQNGPIPLSELDTNFATSATLGNTPISLGAVTSTVDGLTLTNVNIASGTATISSITGATISNSAIVSSTIDNSVIGGTTPANGNFIAITANQDVTGALAAGAISYGTLGYSDNNILASFASNVNSYNQMILQNNSSLANASTNFNVSNNNATSTSGYGEFGINSSTFTGVGAFNQSNNVYLAAASSDLAIGTYGNNPIHFVVGSNSLDAATISSSGVFSSGAVSLTGGTVSGVAINSSVLNNDTLNSPTLNGAITASASATLVGTFTGSAATLVSVAIRSSTFTGDTISSSSITGSTISASTLNGSIVSSAATLTGLFQGSTATLTGMTVTSSSGTFISLTATGPSLVATNTAFGTSALNTSTGASNVGLGLNAGSIMTTGNQNVILGSFTGSSAGLAIQTASNYTVFADGGANVNQFMDNNGNVFLLRSNLWQYAPAPTSLAASTTLTASQVSSDIIQITATAVTVTLPTASAMDTGFPGTTAGTVTNVGIDFHIVNTSAGTTTVAVNTGITSVGTLTVATLTSGHFRLRRTATATYILYRLS
jgi:hypothetical protein